MIPPVSWIDTLWASLGESAWPMFGLGALAGLILGIAVTVVIAFVVFRRKMRKATDELGIELGRLLSGVAPHRDPWADADTSAVERRMGW